MNKWPSISLGEIFEIARGGSPRPIQNFITNQRDGINWIMIGDAFEGSKYITSTKKRILSSGVSKSRMVYPGDFLLTNSMSFGHPYILKISGCIHDGWLVLSKKQNNIDQNYFYHLLGSDTVYSEFVRRASGTTVKNLNIDLVSGVKISLPPLAEQRRIAAILDKADAVRRKRKEAIALAEDLLRSAFLEMFGDPVANPNVKMLPKGWIKTNVDSIKADAKWSCVGGPFGSNLTTKDYVAIPGVPVIRGNNLSKESLYISESGFTYVSQEKADSLLQNTAYPGDILFTQRGTLGQVGMLPEDSRFPRYVVSQSQMKLTPDLNIVSPTWLVAYFQSPVALRTLRTQVLATGVPHINLSILKNFPVNLPPIEQQKKYSKFCKQHLLILEKQKNSCSEAEDLFDSLLQRAFRGDL